MESFLHRELRKVRHRKIEFSLLVKKKKIEFDICTQKRMALHSFRQ